MTLYVNRGDVVRAVQFQKLGDVPEVMAVMFVGRTGFIAPEYIDRSGEPSRNDEARTFREIKSGLHGDWLVQDSYGDRWHWRSDEDFQREFVLPNKLTESRQEYHERLRAEDLARWEAEEAAENARLSQEDVTTAKLLAGVDDEDTRAAVIAAASEPDREITPEDRAAAERFIAEFTTPVGVVPALDPLGQGGGQTAVFQTGAVGPGGVFPLMLNDASASPVVVNEGRVDFTAARHRVPGVLPLSVDETAVD